MWISTLMDHGPDEESRFHMSLHLLLFSAPAASSITFAPERPGFSVALCCPLDRTQCVLELLWLLVSTRCIACFGRSESAVSGELVLVLSPFEGRDDSPQLFSPFLEGKCTLDLRLCLNIKS